MVLPFVGVGVCVCAPDLHCTVLQVVKRLVAVVMFLQEEIVRVFGPEGERLSEQSLQVIEESILLCKVHCQ